MRIGIVWERLLYITPFGSVMTKYDQDLTQRQYDFVLNYIKNGFNAKQAAIQAGYSSSYAHYRAHALLDHPMVRNRIERAHQKIELKREANLMITYAEKVEILKRIIYDIVPKDPSEEPKRKLYPEAIKAMSELNKMQGDYAPDKRLSVTVDATKEKLIDARRQYEEY